MLGFDGKTFGLSGLVLIASAATFSPAQALNCTDTASNQEMIQFAWQDYQRADKELNRVYQRVIARMKSDFADNDPKESGQDPEADLRDAQRKWVAFRDANCRWSATQMLGGTGQPLLVNGCLAGMTKKRVEELKEYIGEEAGGRSAN